MSDSKETHKASFTVQASVSYSELQTVAAVFGFEILDLKFEIREAVCCS